MNHDVIFAAWNPSIPADFNVLLSTSIHAMQSHQQFASRHRYATAAYPNCSDAVCQSLRLCPQLARPPHLHPLNDTCPHERGGAAWSAPLAPVRRGGGARLASTPAIKPARQAFAAPVPASSLPFARCIRARIWCTTPGRGALAALPQCLCA